MDRHVSRGEPDVVSFGRLGTPRSRLRGWFRGRRAVLATGVALVVVAAVLAWAVAARGHGHSAPRRARPVTLIDAGHRLLGVRASWEVFAAGSGVLLRIRLAAGVITRTAVPPLLSSGPVSFVVGPRQAVIRPLDFVPGYLVHDGRPARRLPAAMGRAGVAFPGPGVGLLWVQTGFGAHNVMSLVTYAGRHLGRSVAFPGPSVYVAVPDGRGYFLVQDRGVVYDVHPSGRQRVASGTLDAAGPSAWLVTQCSGGHCRNLVIDPANGARRRVPGWATPPAAATQPGVTSPDGLFAAVERNGPGHGWRVHLISLLTGADRTLPVRVSEPYVTSVLAWSPDSRWLFAVTESGSLIAIDPATGQPAALGVPLPPVTQLAIRVAS